MKRRFLTLLTAAVAVFASCNSSNTLTPDNIEPDLSGIPELPADPQPGSTSFNHRIMLLQHTGTYCPNCPNLMTSLKEVAQDTVLITRTNVRHNRLKKEGQPLFSYGL